MLLVRKLSEVFGTQTILAALGKTWAVAVFCVSPCTVADVTVKLGERLLAVPSYYLENYRSKKQWINFYKIAQQHTFFFFFPQCKYSIYSFQVSFPGTSIVCHSFCYIWRGSCIGRSKCFGKLGWKENKINAFNIYVVNKIDYKS